MLEVRAISKAYGGIRALSNVSFELAAGEIAGLIGPNGSGKSTLFNIISGFSRPLDGEIVFLGRPIGGRRPEEIVSLGIARTFQLARPFATLSVLDNVLLAAHSPGESPGRALFGRSSTWERREDGERARELLELVRLWGHRDHAAGSLSYGQTKLLALAGALMLRPKLLLLDEPTAGVSPALSLVIHDAISRLNDAGLTFLIVEHDMQFVMNLCERLIVLDHGERIATGTPQEIQSDSRVVEAYLGGAA
jgi:ABC-type branched-subunit amino acid transport system ATPase component